MVLTRLYFAECYIFSVEGAGAGGARCFCSLYNVSSLLVFLGTIDTFSKQFCRGGEGAGHRMEKKDNSPKGLHTAMQAARR